MDSASSDDDSLRESFCIVRRGHCPNDGDAVYVPTPIMAAVSPDKPSSPMSDGAQQRQPRPAGTDPEGAGAVDAPMAMEWRSPDPPPRSESSGARRWRQPTTRRPGALTLRPPHTVESIIDDFKKRKAALVRALTEDVEAFFQKCDPGMQPLHLYGGTDGIWEVKPPEVMLPPPEPEPIPGINILRDTMERREWLQQVAVYCDAWLFSIASFAASCITATERGRMFGIIAVLPTVLENLLDKIEGKRSSSPEANAVVEEKEEVRYAEEKRCRGPDEANEVVEEEQEVYLTEEQRSNGPTQANEILEEMEEEDGTDDDNNCASCGDPYKANSFWISCDACNKWYHGKCVKVTAREAENIKHYECPDCLDERAGHDRN